jgi:hypothetical protein
MINRKIFESLVKRIGTEAGVYSAIRRKQKLFQGTIKSEIAAYIIAAENHIKVSKYLKDEELSKVQELIKMSPSPTRIIKEKDKVIKPPLQKINPYNLSLNHFDIEPELVKDCKLVKPYRGSVREALLTLETEIKSRLGISKSLAGRKVIKECKKMGVFERHEPSEEEGLYFLFSGAILWMRNPPSHKKLEYSKKEAIQVILFMDYLIKLFYKLCEENNIPSSV